MPSSLNSWVERGDRELAQWARDGSLDAFEELVRRHEGRIYRFARRLCGNEEDARDVTQEAFVKAFRMLDRYDPSQEFAPWLFTIARRRAIDHLRSRRNESGEPAGEVAGPDDPASLLALREQRGALWAFARKVLPDVQFQALWLHYAEEMDTAQAASVLGISRTHAKVLLWRGRTLLASRLKFRHADRADILSRGPACGAASGNYARPDYRFVSKGSV